MSATAASVNFTTLIAPEDRARADVYALLSRLFYDAPDEALLATIAGTGGAFGESTESSLAATWDELVLAAAQTDVAAVTAEYNELFVSAGEADVTLYGYAYVPGVAHEKLRALLREQLESLGLARREEIGEPEDHVSALCDVMRFQIIGSGPLIAAPLSAQRAFFRAHIAPWFDAFTREVEKRPNATFYGPAAAFMRAFFELELEAFDVQ